MVSVINTLNVGYSGAKLAKCGARHRPVTTFTTSRKATVLLESMCARSRRLTPFSHSCSVLLLP